MNKETTAMFIGHWHYYSFSREALFNATKYLIDIGVTDFLNGGEGTFNKNAAVIVHMLKKRYSHIKSRLVMPYKAFIYDERLFDEVIYPDCFVSYSVMVSASNANKYIAKRSSYAICCINHRDDQVCKYYDEAVKNNLKIINIGDLRLRNT